MPYVAITTVKGVLDIEQKRMLLERVTDLMVEVEGQGNEEFRKLVWVKIEEQGPEHWCLGGVIPTPERIAKTFGSIGANGTRAKAGV